MYSSPILNSESAKKSSINFDRNTEFFGEKIYQAIEYLDFKSRSITNAVEAYKRLEKIVNEQKNFKIFQKLFPKEWEGSKASLFKAGFYEKYSERTNELFELVNKNMFPLLSGWNEDAETEFENFYICTLNLDLCCEEIDFEGLRVSYVATLLIFMQDMEIWEYFNTHYGLEEENFPAINGRSHENLWKMEKQGRQGLYIEIFEIVDHSTGNPWFDLVNCRNDEWFDWNENTLKYLAESFIEASDLLDRTCLLDEIFEADPHGTLLEMITFWNLGQEIRQEKQAVYKRRKRENIPLDFYDY